jgi:hypothetical protein
MIYSAAATLHLQPLLDPTHEARVDMHPGEAALHDHLATMTQGRGILDIGVIRVGNVVPRTEFTTMHILPGIPRRPSAVSQQVLYIAIAKRDLDKPSVAQLVDRLCPQIWSRPRPSCHKEDTRNPALVLIP